jgi:hypothetical protein
MGGVGGQRPIGCINEPKKMAKKSTGLLIRIRNRHYQRVRIRFRITRLTMFSSTEKSKIVFQRNLSCFCSSHKKKKNLKSL